MNVLTSEIVRAEYADLSVLLASGGAVGAVPTPAASPRALRQRRACLTNELRHIVVVVFGRI